MEAGEIHLPSLVVLGSFHLQPERTGHPGGRGVELYGMVLDPSVFSSVPHDSLPALHTHTHTRAAGRDPGAGPLPLAESVSPSYVTSHRRLSLKRQARETPFCLSKARKPSPGRQKR